MQGVISVPHILPPFPVHGPRTALELGGGGGGSRGCLRKSLKMEPLRLAKNAFPAYS